VQRVDVMETQFDSVSDSAALEQLFARSHEGPVILFKHSNACPISARAYRQMESVKSPVALVVVQKSRDVSREVEERTGVRHETPQALVLRDGRVVWSATHFDVTADAVERAMQESE
jgi:bacillithiol system protein YtxJ